MRKLKISLAIILVAVISLCNSSFLYAKNVYADSIILPLIQNQSFETEGGWDIEATDATLDESKINYLNENAYDGEKYLQLSDGEYIVKTSDYIEIDGGDNYIFGVKFTASVLDVSCQVIIETFDSSNNFLGNVSGEIKNPMQVGSWTDVQAYFTADDNVAKVKIAMDLNALNASVGLDYAYGNKDIVETVFGASISLQKGKSSIRFTGRVDKNAFDQYPQGTASFGILFAPTSAVESAGDFTINGIGLDVGRAVILGTCNNGDTADLDGYYEFICAMGNMHVKEALNLSISVRMFVKIQEGESERYIYSTFDLEDNSRSIKDVALRLKENTETYAKYDDVQRAIIDAYALGELPQ